MNKHFMIVFSLAALIGISLAQEEQEFELKDGTKLKGIVLEETDDVIKLATGFGTIELKKENIVSKSYKVILNSGEEFVGKKQSESDDVLILKTSIGEINIQKMDIVSIEEVGATSKSQPTQYNRRRGGLLGLFDFAGSSRDVDFSLGEEQLIDLFFDPTGYTLDQSTLYLSGLSFGFGVTDKLQITTKWGGFFWGNMNFRPKFKVFEKGNWQKQQALSVGAHYHSRWWPNRYEWKSGSVQVDGQEKYWGGFYNIGENPEYNYEDSGSYWDNDCCIERVDEQDEFYIEMVEIFGAYTSSSARPGLKGRTSHTIGGNVQYVISGSEMTAYYRAYYGLDIDINPKLKMIGEVFYDPNYLELWQKAEYDFDYWDSDELSDTPIEKPDDFNPIHLDFGFMYAVSESFRFGIHFQQPFVAFYWKI